MVEGFWGSGARSEAILSPKVTVDGTMSENVAAGDATTNQKYSYLAESYSWGSSKDPEETVTGICSVCDAASLILERKTATPFWMPLAQTRVTLSNFEGVANWKAMTKRQDFEVTVAPPSEVKSPSCGRIEAEGSGMARWTA